MGLLSSYANYEFDLDRMAQQYQYDTKMLAQQYWYDYQQAELQNQYNVDMWRMQNRYNSPAEQMKRLVAAGLSPNLAYGSISMGNATSAPSMVAPGMKAAGRQAAGAKTDFNLIDTAMQLLNFRESLQQMRMKTNLMRQDYETKILKNQKLFTVDLEKAYAEMYGLKRSQGWTPGEYDDGVVWSPGQKALGEYYNSYYTKRLQQLGNTNALLSGRLGFLDEQKRGQVLRNTYQNQINSMYKTDKYFNYIDRGLNTLFNGLGIFFGKGMFNGIFGGGQGSRYNPSPRYYNNYNFY